jgi:hypothetical protein
MDILKGLDCIVEWLEKKHISYMVVGGIANLVWGEPRLTQDIDITVATSIENLLQMLPDFPQNFQVLTDEPATFLKRTYVLPLRVSGVRIDLILADLSYEKKAIYRAQRISLENVFFQVSTPEDLIIYKAISERPRDWEDIQGIILRQSSLDWKYLETHLKAFSRVLDKNLWDEITKIRK